MDASHNRMQSAGCHAVIAALLFALLRIAPVSAAELAPFKIGLSETVNTALAIWMAEDAGFYVANGLKVEIINMQGGSRGAAELAAGRLDAMHVGLSSVIGLQDRCRSARGRGPRQRRSLHILLGARGDQSGRPQGWRGRDQLVWLRN